MSRNLCFIVVGGITRQVAPENDPSSLVGKLEQWFPNCRCIVHNLFVEPTGKFSNGKQLMEEEAKPLLDKVSLDFDVRSRLHDEGSFSKDQGSTLSLSGLVFFGHDLGGSVIMKALVLAHREDPFYRSVLENTIATVFFGTPQRAPISESWEKHMVNLLSISPLRMNMLLAGMKDLSDVLSGISESFSSISGSYKLCNVYEQPIGKSGSNLNTVISKYSATIDTFTSESFGVSSDHTNLCDIHNGEPLAKWLELKLKRLQNVVDETASVPDQYRNFSRELATIDPNLHQMPEKLPAYCSMDWVNTHSGYKNWESAKDIEFLYICGNPGSGASVLASYIVSLVQEAHWKKETYFLNFSFNDQDVHGSSTEAMLLSFVRQLLSQNPNLFRHTARLSTRIIQRKCINEKSLWAAFWSLVSHIDNGQIVVSIRAVQEFSSVFDFTLNYLSSLRRLPNLVVKIIIASDDTNEGSPSWARCLEGKQLHTIRLENDEGVGWRHSVEELLQSRVDRLLESRAFCRDLGGMVMDNFWSSTPSLY